MVAAVEARGRPQPGQEPELEQEQEPEPEPELELEQGREREQAEEAEEQVPNECNYRECWLVRTTLVYSQHQAPSRQRESRECGPRDICCQ